MKSLLSVLFKQSTLGENLITKTLTRCSNEFLHAFHFLLSYWRPAFFYGRTQTRATLPFSSLKQSQETTLVYRAIQPIQTASIKRTKRTSKQLNEDRESKEETLSSKAGTHLAGLKEILKLDRFSLRLFNGLYTFWENKRLRWGMFFLLIFAPFSKFLYMLFPAGGFGEYLINAGPIKILNTIELIQGGWYFGTFKMYFFSIGELLGPVLSIIGIFFLFPKKYYPSYLIGVPFGYYMSMLVHRMFFVTDYESFHAGATATMTFTFLVLGVVFFAVSDKVLFPKNHTKRASEARIIGLINMPGMEWHDKEALIKKEVSEVMKVDNELFIKETA